MTAPELIVLKIGGSLVSRRELDDDLDLTQLRRYALMLRRLTERCSTPVVLVVGGGSYGHGAVRGAERGRSLELVRLVAATARLRGAWCEALIAAGVAAMPLQPSALAFRRGDGLRHWAQPMIAMLHERSFLPVLSGDSLVSGPASLQVLGSDHIPALVVDAQLAPVDRVRVVVLTDVAGLREGGRTGALVREVDPRQPASALAAVWQPGAADMTGGMAGKLAALLELSSRGVECLIMCGGQALDSPELLWLPYQAWPVDQEATRICVPGRPSTGPPAKAKINVTANSSMTGRRAGQVSDPPMQDSG